MYTYDEKMAHIVAQFMHFDQALANDEQNKVIYYGQKIIDLQNKYEITHYPSEMIAEIIADNRKD
jgi:hypothetical protein